MLALDKSDAPPTEAVAAAPSTLSALWRTAVVPRAALAAGAGSRLIQFGTCKTVTAVRETVTAVRKTVTAICKTVTAVCKTVMAIRKAVDAVGALAPPSLQVLPVD